jgi:RNA polymerase sigma-B factor
MELATATPPTPAYGRVPETATEMVRATARMPKDHPGYARARSHAIEAWLPLARNLALRYAGRGEPDSDLIQTATVGLIKAIDRYDPERGVDFTGFAIPTILGEVKRHFRDRTWAVRVSRRMQELRIAVNEATVDMTSAFGRSPTVAEVAAYLNTTDEAVLEGLEGGRAYSAASLSTPITPDGNAELGDTLGEADHDMELAELRIALGPAMATLDERERRILSLRFYGNLTQTEIAEQIGISQMHVSRLLTRALGRLRRQLAAG